MRTQAALRHAAIALALALIDPPAPAQPPSPHAIDIPRWFVEGFLDFQEEAAVAARAGKRLLVYFGQDGCPYCRELMQTNFSQRAIVEKTRAHFESIAINIWGDREVTWVDGRRTIEKELARELKVQFTPTVLFLDSGGGVVARLNGYHPPHRFSAALDYVAGRHERSTTLGEYLQRSVSEPAAAATLHEQPFFMKPPHDLRRKPGDKPLAVLFETRHCKPCDEMHREAFVRREVRARLREFDIARFALSDGSEITTPAGRQRRADAWARELGVAYTPTLLFFDVSNAEVFRVEGYARPFHFASAFEYVSSGAYRDEPQFQRFVQRKAERLRAQGRKVELWR